MNIVQDAQDQYNEAKKNSHLHLSKIYAPKEMIDPRVRAKNKAIRVIIALEEEFILRPDTYAYRTAWLGKARWYHQDLKTRYKNFGGPELLDYCYKVYLMFLHLSSFDRIIEYAKNVDGKPSKEIEKDVKNVIKKMKYGSEERYKAVLLWGQLMMQNKFKVVENEGIEDFEKMRAELHERIGYEVKK